MKIYLKDDVLTAARRRVKWVYEEFGDQVIVNVSGGKDSTVVWELAREAVKELGIGKVKTLFIDQEAEWAATIDQIRYMMYHEDTEPYWYQIPMLLSNATSSYEQWLRCWDPEEEERWMRPKDPISIKENTFGTERFKKLFNQMHYSIIPEGGANIAGIRGEEAPGRLLSLTTKHCYGGVTWGSGPGRYNGYLYWGFCPIYDWTYSDVWKAIHEHDWEYCKIYDAMYAQGISVRQMRVSNVHHEEAVGSLFYMQEVEPDTWERLTNRIQGIDSAGKFGKADFMPKQLPYMFSSWKEYRDYLLPRLVTKDEWVQKMRKLFDRHDRLFGDHLGNRTYQLHVEMILTNDWEGAKSAQFEVNARNQLKRLGVA